MRIINPLWVVWPFWLYIFIYKISSSIHYSIGSPLGEQVLPLWMVGLAIGLAAGIQLILDVPAGFLLDRFGYKRLLGVGTAIFMAAISCLFFGLTPTTYLMTLGLGALGWLFLTWVVSFARTAIHPGLSHAAPARYVKPHRVRHKT